MKKLLFSLALVLIAVLGIYLVSNTKSELVTTNTDSKSQTGSQPASQVPAGLDHISYRFAIDSQIKSSQHDVSQDPVQGSKFNGYISLKKRDDGNGFNGQLIDAQVSQNNQTNRWPDPIYFTTGHENFVFSNIDFLGLPQGHPGHAIAFVLEQLSYQTSQPLIVRQATGTAQYQYIKLNDTIRRKKLTENFNQAQPANSKEHWHINLLDNGWPKDMRFYASHDFASEQGLLNVNQKVFLEISDIKTRWQDNQFIANANINQTFDKQQPVTVDIQINNPAELNTALAKLAESTDKVLAQAIGEYLLANYSDHDIVNLIHAKDPSSKLASLIIYSIQKVSGFAAEVMLNQLYHHPELDVINKQRVLMSMGRFEGASEQTLNALRNINQKDENRTMANTAMLSMGSLARFSTSQKQAVEDYLATKLAEPGFESVTITAIKNSGSTRFNPQVENMLGHERESVNVAAIKLLARDAKYQDKLVDYVADSGQAKSITALRIALSNKGLKLTPTQKDRLEDALQQASHPVVKKQLVALLQMEDQSWSD